MKCISNYQKNNNNSACQLEENQNIPFWKLRAFWNINKECTSITKGSLENE